MSFRLRGISIHSAENLFIPGHSVVQSLDIYKHNVRLEEEDSGKVNVYYEGPNPGGNPAEILPQKRAIGPANIKAYIYEYIKEEKKK